MARLVTLLFAIVVGSASAFVAPMTAIRQSAVAQVPAPSSSVVMLFGSKPSAAPKKAKKAVKKKAVKKVVKKAAPKKAVKRGSSFGQKTSNKRQAGEVARSGGDAVQTFTNNLFSKKNWL